MRIKHRTDDWAASMGDLAERRYKRPLDLTTLVAAHIALLPLWVLLWITIPLCIWIEDRGPIFYVQQRVGRGGRIFGMFKFRSMRVKQDREEWLGSTSTDDPRITKMGRLLRRTALDELPQIINLWKGDTSFVGPRALPRRRPAGSTTERPRADVSSLVIDGSAVTLSRRSHLMLILPS